MALGPGSPRRWRCSAFTAGTPRLPEAAPGGAADRGREVRLSVRARGARRHRGPAGARSRGSPARLLQDEQQCDDAPAINGDQIKELLGQETADREAVAAAVAEPPPRRRPGAAPDARNPRARMQHRERGERQRVPIYEYECHGCRRRVSLLVRTFRGARPPDVPAAEAMTCPPDVALRHPEVGGRSTRRARRPRAVRRPRRERSPERGALLKKMGEEMGEDLGDDLDAAMDEAMDEGGGARG